MTAQPKMTQYQRAVLATIAKTDEQETVLRKWLELQLKSGDCDGLNKLNARVNELARPCMDGAPVDTSDEGVDYIISVLAGCTIARLQRAIVFEVEVGS